MLSRLSSIHPSNSDDEVDRKVQPEIWDRFADHKTQDVIVELVLPQLSFAAKPAHSKGRGGHGIWPLPPTADESDAVSRTFGQTKEQLGGIGISKITELRSAGSIVVRANRRQIGMIAELPTVRRIYANTSI